MKTRTEQSVTGPSGGLWHAGEVEALVMNSKRQFKATEPVEGIIRKHPLFADLSPQYLSAIAGCSSLAQFEPNDFLFREGQESTRFFLIQTGRVTVEVSVPEHGCIEIKNLSEGDFLGWSWLFPPYSHHSDARALEATRAFAFDGADLRAKCDLDPGLGYDLMKRFARIMMSTLQSTRLQLIDLHRSDAVVRTS